jgi:hypothetical protein
MSEQVMDGDIRYLPIRLPRLEIRKVTSHEVAKREPPLVGKR